MVEYNSANLEDLQTKKDKIRDKQLVIQDLDLYGASRLISLYAFHASADRNQKWSS